MKKNITITLTEEERELLYNVLLRAHSCARTDYEEGLRLNFSPSLMEIYKREYKNAYDAHELFSKKAY